MKVGKIKSMSKGKKILSVLLIIALIGGVLYMRRPTKANAEVALKTYTVDNGSIKVSLSGSASVSPKEQYDVVALVSGEILEDYIEEGQEVNAGDLLYKIDQTDALSEIEKSELSYEKNKLNYDQSLQSLDDLKIYAPASGTITSLSVKKGDSVNNNSKVAEITDYKSLKLTIPFNSTDAKNIYAGENATVTLDETGTTISGTVSKVFTGEYATETGALVTDVEISFTNPGTVTANDSASAIIGDYACNKSGTISYQTVETVVAKTQGDVTQLNFAEGDVINKGDLLLVLENDSLDISIKSSELSLKDSQLSIDDKYSNLDNYNITSTISGTVIQKNMKAGDTLSGGNNSNTTLAVIADMSSLSFELNIDELDISEVEVGQEVTITADALPGKTFTGVVSKKSIMGSYSNGVTSYPVTIVIDEYEGLLPSMNVNAEIVLDEVDNVLTVPVAAIERGNMVLVSKDSLTAEQISQLNDSSSSDDNTNGKPSMNNSLEAGSVVTNMEAPDGYVYVKVETGLTDSDMTEITKGLTQGMVIAYKQTEKESSTQNDMMGMPGMDGGMPGGQAPGGGNGAGGPGGMQGGQRPGGM